MFVFVVLFDLLFLNVFGLCFGCVQCLVFGMCFVVFGVQLRCSVLFYVWASSSQSPGLVIIMYDHHM